LPTEKKQKLARRRVKIDFLQIFRAIFEKSKLGCFSLNHTYELKRNLTFFQPYKPELAH
jgi:hypothetical protein